MIQTEKGEAGCKRHKMALSRGNCGKLKLTNLQLKLNSLLSGLADLCLVWK